MAAVENAALMLADLEGIAREWDRLPEGERVSWSLDWSNEMSGLERVATDALSGLLTPSQERAYRALVQRLAKARPLLMTLGLYLPDVSLST
jgi:hypothetical protein